MTDANRKKDIHSSGPGKPYSPRAEYLKRNPSEAKPDRYTITTRQTSISSTNSTRTKQESAVIGKGKPATIRTSSNPNSSNLNTSTTRSYTTNRGRSHGAPSYPNSRTNSSTRNTSQPKRNARPSVGANRAQSVRTHTANPTIESRNPRQKAQRSPLLFAFGAVVAVVAIGFAAFSIISPAEFKITLNGQETTMHRGDTIETILEQKLAQPEPGDFIAVDGSVLEEGSGDKFDLLINEQDVSDASTRVYKNDVVVISDGANIMEEYDAETIEVAPERTEEGWGAIHVYVTGESGIIERRTGKTSGIKHDETIKSVIDESYIQYNADISDAKVIALTFDDGPWPEYTDEILNILDEHDAKATFFTIGDQISNHTSTVARMSDAGHQICTHTWDHASGSGQGVNLTFMTSAEQIEQVTKGYEAIEAVTGNDASRVIRAPGGNYSGSIIWTLAKYVSAEIGWNVDTEDWRTPGADVIAERIMSAESGEIVLMHDGGGDRSQTVEALRTALPYLKEQGYTFITIDELLAYNNPIEMVEN